MKCGADNTNCMARHGNQCMEHLMTDTPGCPSRAPLTNGDYLRGLSDEDLAINRVKYQYTSGCSLDSGEYFIGDFGCVHIASSKESDWEAAREKAIQLELDWLRQPKEGNRE